MPVIVYRQPWFWGVIVAALAILGCAIMIGASNRNHDRDSTTIVQQPSPAANPVPVVTPVTPAPSSSLPYTATAPVQPASPVTPAPAAKPAPRVIVHEKTVVVHDPAPAPNSPADGSTATTSTVPAADQFLSTGLPKLVKFEDSDWKATSTTRVTDPQDNLTSVGTTEDGTALFAHSGATEPYQTVLAPVSGRPRTYVQYQRQ